MSEEYHRVSKFWDKTFYTIPYGWRIYYKWCDICRFLKSSYQKLTRGFSDEECWNLDYTIAKFILPRLKHFKKHNYGLPWRSHKMINGEVVELMESEKIYDRAIDGSLTSEEWDDVLNNIIFAFEFILDEDEWSKKCYAPRFFEEPYGFIENIGKKKPLRYPIKPNYDMYKKAEKYASNGMKLFALYHRGLWD
jgi:hypothetical protein